jgi:hypothetical protein
VAGALVVNYIAVRILSPNYNLLPYYPNTTTNFSTINISLADELLEGGQSVAKLFKF